MFAGSAFASDQWRLERLTADLAHRLGNTRALSLQNFNLSKLRYNLFGLLSFSSHR
jgi:hypothetical protein